MPNGGRGWGVDDGARADEVCRQEARISPQMRVLRECIILMLDARSSLPKPSVAAGRSARLNNLQSRYQAMPEREPSRREPGSGIETKLS